MVLNLSLVEISFETQTDWRVLFGFRVIILQSFASQ